MDVVLMFIIVSIIIEVTSCSCFHQFLYFTHIQQFLLFLFFCPPSHLLHQSSYSSMGVVLIFIIVSIVLEVSHFSCLH